MTTNNFPGIGYNTKGRDFNFYQKVAVDGYTFGALSVSGAQPNIFISFPTQSVMFLNEGTLSTSVVEYSFNGNTVHGELDPSGVSKSLTFDNRVVSFVWFRIKSGSSGPVTVRVDAWGIR